jgi:RNA recognition motif-containing protein
MTPKLYLENISPTTTENELKDLFSIYGNVAEVNIVVDRAPQKPQGLGFVTMVTPEGARAAVQALHGKLIGEHKLKVSEAWPGEGHAKLFRKHKST